MKSDEPGPSGAAAPAAKAVLVEPTVTAEAAPQAATAHRCVPVEVDGDCGVTTWGQVWNREDADHLCETYRIVGSGPPIDPGELAAGRAQWEGGPPLRLCHEEMALLLRLEPPAIRLVAPVPFGTDPDPDRPDGPGPALYPDTAEGRRRALAAWPRDAGERALFAVFQDLWWRGYHLTRGSKLGCEYLAYGGPPHACHAAFAVRVFGKGPAVGSTPLPPMTLLGTARATHAARKHLLIADVADRGDDPGSPPMVEYATITPALGFDPATLGKQPRWWEDAEDRAEQRAWEKKRQAAERERWEVEQRAERAERAEREGEVAAAAADVAAAEATAAGANGEGRDGDANMADAGVSEGGAGDQAEIEADAEAAPSPASASNGPTSPPADAPPGTALAADAHPPETSASLMRLKKAELQERCRSRGLDDGGTKAAMVARLMER